MFRRSIQNFVVEQIRYIIFLSSLFYFWVQYIVLWYIYYNIFTHVRSLQVIHCNLCIIIFITLVEEDKEEKKLSHRQKQRAARRLKKKKELLEKKKALKEAKKNVAKQHEKVVKSTEESEDENGTQGTVENYKKYLFSSNSHRKYNIFIHSVWSCYFFLTEGSIINFTTQYNNITIIIIR